MENERLIKSESIFIMKIVLYTNENHVCNFLFTVVHFVSNFLRTPISNYVVITIMISTFQVLTIFWKL